MLGLGNTLSGGIVPAAAGAAFADDYSILLDGTDDHMTADDAIAEITGDLGSISMWFRFDTSTHTASIVNIPIDSNNYIWIYYHGGTNQTRMEHAGGGSEETLVTTTAVEDGNWHHLVCTWNTGSNASAMYIDGSSVDTGTAADFTGTLDAVDFGKKRGSSWLQWPGNFNDIAFFDDVLTSGEVSDIYNSGDPTDLSSHGGLVAYWKLEQNTDDSSSNSNSIVLANGADYEAETP